jgi:hypothetical protein
MTKVKSGKKPPRNQVKNPALKKKYNSRILQEYIDYDYLDELDEETLKWLNKFTEEFHKASYKHDGTDIHDYNQIIGVDEKGKDITYGRDSNDRNNGQNRCQYGHLRNKADRNNNKKLLNYEGLVNANDPSKSLELEYPTGHNPAIMENAYVDFLESKEIEAMMLEYDQAMEQFTEVSEIQGQPQLESPELLVP